MMEQPFARDLYPRRLHELEAQFADLAPQIPDSPEKQALSVLHGITQELWRNLRQPGSPLSERGVQLQDIADLYRHAPAMEGAAVHAPLPVGTPAPEFVLPDASGRPISLAEYR